MSPQSMQLIYRRSGHHYNDRRHRIRPPPQQQHHYLINNHIIQQQRQFDSPTLLYSAPPMMMTALSPWLQMICSNGHHQHDQRNRRKTPLLHLHHQYSSNTTVRQIDNIRFSARRSAFRCRCYHVIPSSLMQPIIINNIKQAHPLNDQRQEIIYYGWRRREWGRNDGRDIINTTNINYLMEEEGWEDDRGNDDLGG